MSVLTIQAALALSLQCAPSVDPHMIVAIGQHESGLDPLTIHDNTTGLVLHGEGAASTARQLIAAGTNFSDFGDRCGFAITRQQTNPHRVTPNHVSARSVSQC